MHCLARFIVGTIIINEKENLAWKVKLATESLHHGSFYFVSTDKELKIGGGKKVTVNYDKSREGSENWQKLIS